MRCFRRNKSPEFRVKIKKARINTIVGSESVPKQISNGKYLVFVMTNVGDIVEEACVLIFFAHPLDSNLLSPKCCFLVKKSIVSVIKRSKPSVCLRIHQRGIWNLNAGALLFNILNLNINHTYLRRSIDNIFPWCWRHG